MAADDSREGLIVPVSCVACEQFQIGVAHVQKDNVAGRESRQTFWRSQVRRLYPSMMNALNVRLPRFGDAIKPLAEL